MRLLVIALESDPAGAEGSTVIVGCPCTRPEFSWVCCPGDEDSFSCEDGVWHYWLDGCNPPPCDEDGGAACNPEPMTHVSCVRS